MATTTSGLPKNKSEVMMTTEELIKELNGIMSGEGEFPLPDTMIDDIIKKLQERDRFEKLVVELNDKITAILRTK